MTMMKLLEFRVTNFRSVRDSGWIKTEDVTALVGVNESGKSNLLLPLWKLNPAKEGAINLLDDAPRTHYPEIKENPDKPVFIEAHFELPDDLIAELVDLTGATYNDLKMTSVARNLGGGLTVGFPNATPLRQMDRKDAIDLLTHAHDDITGLSFVKSEESIRANMLSSINTALSQLSSEESQTINESILQGISKLLSTVEINNVSKRSLIGPRYGQLIDEITALITQMSKPHPASSTEVRKRIVEEMPKFVYYSNYGNLDSEIYLPHVIANMSRSDLGGKEEAKARTLKVLFSFVRLSPQEIQELGRDLPQQGSTPNEDQIKAIAARKKEREVLLQSASSQLTRRFRDWWKQGIYKLRFQADGDHFRIWVSDDIRPEEIELEGRSTGLQWFLSFYLIFLVESEDTHEGCILLLDEPGLSLHPLSQRDLSLFFENLASTNQILYTTHSPFLVDPDHLDRVRSVYIDGKGATAVSSNLRANEADPSQAKSIYAVHAALGLTVSDVLLQGCQPIIVEGQSDQIALSAIKTYLIRHDHINPKHEMVFLPAGGVKGMNAVITIVTGKHDSLPYVVLDGDKPGLDKAKSLRQDMYRQEQNRVLIISDICEMQNAEIEDLFPVPFFSDIVTRYFHRQAQDFSEIVQPGLPMVKQIEEYAALNEIDLDLGWKVELARLAKERILKGFTILEGDEKMLSRWKGLFTTLET